MSPLSGPKNLRTFNEARLVASHAGRFSLRVETALEQAQGLQGRFEWVELASADTPYAERHVLIWIGPLGQALGRIERETTRLDDQISIFNDQGLQLSAEQQSLFMKNALGPVMTPAEVTPFALDLMRFFKTALQSPAAMAETELQFKSLVIKLRVVPDV